LIEKVLAKLRDRYIYPDIAVPQEEALQTAHILALKHILEQGRHPARGPRKGMMDEARQALKDLESDAGEES
jgi:hypothetical protein